MNALLLLLALASDPIPLGSSRLELDIDGTKLEVFVHKPESYRGEKLLVVMHGVEPQRRRVPRPRGRAGATLRDARRRARSSTRRASRRARTSAAGS
jgi:hypothetical protein